MLPPGRAGGGPPRDGGLPWPEPAPRPTPLRAGAAGTRPTHRASSDWFRDEGSSFRPLPPGAVSGEVLARGPGDPRRGAARPPPPPGETSTLTGTAARAQS